MPYELLVNTSRARTWTDGQIVIVWTIQEKCSLAAEQDEVVNAAVLESWWCLVILFLIVLSCNLVANWKTSNKMLLLQFGKKEQNGWGVGNDSFQYLYDTECYIGYCLVHHAKKAIALWSSPSRVVCFVLLQWSNCKVLWRCWFVLQ